MLGFIWQLSATDQVWIAILSITVALLDAAPIELHRRIINTLTNGHDFSPILLLASVYVGLIIAQGSVKLLLNIYRSWVSESSIQGLRIFISKSSYQQGAPATTAEWEGVEISMIVAESDPVGSFVGTSISEPLQQVGVIVSVLGYLAALQPFMALVSFAIFAPQFIFVPTIQRSINERVKKRIKALRSASAEIVESESDASLALIHQDARFAQIFKFDMGVFELKFSLNFLMNLTHHLGVAAVLGLGGWYVVHGQTQVGTVVAFVSGLSTIKDPWGDLVSWYQNLMVTNAKYKLIAGRFLPKLTS